MKEINGRPAIERHIGCPSGDNSISIYYSLVNTVNYITLNMFPTALLNSLEDFLGEMSFAFIEDKKALYDKRHMTLRQYEHTHLIAYDGKPYRVELLLYPKEFRWTGITIKIFYPSKEILDFWVDYFLSVKTMPNISFLELTFDCYTDKTKALFDFLNSHLVMRYNSSEPNIYEKGDEVTHYQTKKPKTKGMRSYIKTTMQPSPVRVELFVNRDFIRNLEINLETLEQDLMKIDYSKYFEFRVFLEEAYIKRQEYWMEKKFKEDRKKKFRRVRKSWTLDDSHALHRNLVSNGIANLLIDDLDGSRRSVAYIYSDLKKNKNGQQSKFCPKLPVMNEVFLSGINGRSFL